MIKFQHLIEAEEGLHARPVALVAYTLTKCASDVQISFNGKTASGRDLMEMLTLDANKGDLIDISIVGGNEEQTKEELLKVLP